MSSRKALTKLKAILVIDIVIIAVVGATYVYLQSQNAFAARPAEFILSNLIITPPEPDLGEPVTISVNVTNIGEVEGGYVANLTINNVVRENQTVAVPAGETVTMQFTDAETFEGNYQVKIGDLSGTFRVKAAPPEDTTIALSNLEIDPHEVWLGNTVSINVTATNQGAENDSLTVRLLIDNLFVENNRITLAPSETTIVQFTVNATVEGSHKVRVNTLFGSFKTVPVGTYTLSILISPTPDEGYAGFTLNGQDQRTPYTEVLPGGTYTIAFPSTDTTGQNAFLYWEDGSTSPTRTITLNKPTILVAYYEKGTSCPSLYIWNGTGFVYVSEVSNHGWLGYTRYVNADGSLEYWRNNPWDYIPLDKSQLQLNNGYFNLSLTQNWDEIFFVDAAYLLVVDHPVGQNVYSTMVEQYIDPEYMGKIYTVSKNPLTPVSAFNEKVIVVNGTVTSSYDKVDALSAISKADGVFTTGFNGKYSEAWNNQTWNRLTLNLGNLASAPQTNLVVKAIVDWGAPESYYLWMNKFYSTQVPDKTEPTPVPFMEVKDANGNWVRVPESRQFPLPPDGVARTYVVNLTGLFPTNDYSLRISNFWNVTFDYVGVDTSIQQNVIVQRINPQANLSQVFLSESTSSGNFTRYGDVTELLLNEDDEFVIGRQGDSISLQYNAGNLTAPAPGMERDYFFFVAAWFKVEYANYGFGPGNNGFTVDPLPFRTMSGFPYPLDKESYPFDDHLGYFQEYNTRIISAPPEQAPPPEPFPITWVIAIIVIVIVANIAILVYFRKHRR